MRKLTVLYDPLCGFCVKCRWWLAMQPAYLELEFLPSGSPEALRRFPGAEAAKGEDLVVIDDEGGVYEGPSAFIMCLYALQEHRELALELASPALMPFARRAFKLLSGSRKWISKLFRLPTEEELAAAIQEGEAEAG